MVEYYAEKIRTGAIHKSGQIWVLELVPAPWREKVEKELAG